MKVAVCFFGLPRCLELSYIFTKHYLIDPLNADVFVHTWDINNGGCRFKYDDSLQIKSNRFRSDNLKSKDVSFPVFSNSSVEEYIKNEIKPKSYFIGIYEDFKNKYGDGSTPAMYYSIQSVNELKNKSNCKYDITIMCRMDTLIKSKIPENEIYNSMNGNIYMSCNRSVDAYSLTPSDMLCDMFIFGNDEYMNIYSNTFETWLNNRNLRSEDTYYQHLNKFKIKPIISDVKLLLMEFFSDNEWYAIYHTKK